MKKTVTKDQLSNTLMRVSDYFLQTNQPFVGATDSVAGSIGMVPTPVAGENDKYLRGDGTWQTPPSATITGVKGDNESEYRTGNVNITKANIGLDNVDNTADENKSVAYASDAGTVNNHTVQSDVPANAVFTDTTYETMTAAEATTGTGTTARVITAKVLADKIAEAIASLVDSSPAALDTLNELAAALGNDPNFATTMATALGNKLDKAGGVVTGNLTVNGTITGNVTGNAATATKLQTARTINIQDATATNTGTGASFDGSGNATIKLPATIKANVTGNCSGSSGSCTGNAATATKINGKTIPVVSSFNSTTGVLALTSLS